MTFHGCFLQTQEGRGGGQRAEEGGQRRLQSLDTHDLLIQSSHNLGGSKVKKVSHSFYIQTAAQIKQTATFIHPGTCSYTRCWIFKVRLEMNLDRCRLKTFQSCCWRREKERPSENCGKKTTESLCSHLSSYHCSARLWAFSAARLMQDRNSTELSYSHTGC